VSAIVRNNVRTAGAGATAMVFAHGLGCDQNMWRYVSSAFEDRFRTVLFDHVGAGGSDLKAYDPKKYSTLAGYADDVVEIGHELGLRGAVFVGHSVSAMIGLLASLRAPGMFKSLVMVGPSPRYVDDENYVGGFKQQQITELLDFLADNHMGWSTAMAPVIMGNADRPELGEELTNCFCRTDPDIAKEFARMTFNSDKPGRPCEGHDTDACPPVQRGCHCSPCSGRVCARANQEQRARRSEGDGPLPEPQCARRSHCGDARLCQNLTI
jgi:sigma-B regulation protein RsbQ